ncbi:hypothetical protein JTE90_021728 [Oedothorax gibbosus]|uniref:Uncharacterized protein n=1 Tax=Oedothorax gibbosus TaxID=931172 RepID=A0AAV6UER9_9ARAC|nr:hypothetical protein JTE90_021728 [Oedothorax gibbosus]
MKSSKIEVSVVTKPYFHEPIESLFKTNLEPVCKEDIEKNETCLTPYVATLCGNIYNSKGFILMIDGVAVMHLTSFMSIVKAMFSSYYVFNIEYPENGHLTLEFMQRCLFNINPQRGSKVQKQKKTKSVVPAQIFKLVENILRVP